MLINGGGRLSGRLVAASAFLVVLAGGASAQTATIDKVQAALPRIEAMAADIVEKGLVPGLAIGIVSGDKVVYLGGFGVREEGKSAKVDADTVFQLASFSKPMAAAVVAALVGEGAVSWDSKIVDLDPLFRLQDPYPTAELTVRDLFSHRSGLPGYAGNELEQARLRPDRDPPSPPLRRSRVEFPHHLLLQQFRTHRGRRVRRGRRRPGLGGGGGREAL